MLPGWNPAENAVSTIDPDRFCLAWIVFFGGTLATVGVAEEGSTESTAGIGQARGYGICQRMGVFECRECVGCAMNAGSLSCVPKAKLSETGSMTE